MSICEHIQSQNTHKTSSIINNLKCYLNLIDDIEIELTP